MSLTDVNSTGDKFIAINPCHGFSVIGGISDTGDKFIAGDNDTGEQLSLVITSKLYSFIPDVVDIHSRISPANFQKSLRNGHNGIIRGTGNTDS
jgi:hypothetical protein